MKFPKLPIANKQIQLSKETVEIQPFIVLPFVGYIILIFSLIDYVEILWPLQLTNQVWEFQTISQLVDHIWSPLIGLAFVFIQKEHISRFQLQVLNFLSWLSFFLGVLYLLMLPLGINDTINIYNTNITQIVNQVAQQKEQFSRLGEQLNIANPAELHKLDKIINSQKITPSNYSPEQLKNKLSQQLETLKSEAASNGKKAQKDLTNNLIKRAIKVNLGIILSGVSLIVLWHLTSWARIWRKWYA